MPEAQKLVEYWKNNRERSMWNEEYGDECSDKLEMNKWMLEKSRIYDR